MSKLAMLFSARAWLQSSTLKVGGLVVALGTFLATDTGQGMLAVVAPLIHLTPNQASAVVVALSGLTTLFLRTHTEWSLAEKVAGANQ